MSSAFFRGKAVNPFFLQGVGGGGYSSAKSAEVIGAAGVTTVFAEVLQTCCLGI